MGNATWSAFLNGHGLQLVALLHLVHHVLAAGDLAEYGVLAVQPIRRDMRDEELAAIGVGAGIGHRERTDFVTIRIALGLVFELITGTAAAAGRRIAALNHEVFDHAMKLRSIVKALAGQKYEIVHRLGRVFREEIADD